LGTMGGDTHTAYELFDEAASLERSDWSPLLRGWVYGCRAEELAALGRADESDRDLEVGCVFRRIREGIPMNPGTPWSEVA
jgi:hypothetical protein